MSKQLLQGNQAIVIAAERAGLGFFAGYPITPASEILHELVGRKHIKVMQMEDEIASINACIGASLAGLKVMTATSGPGFSLMQESIGLAHMMEVPMVIVNVQRVGPSTGMPTFPAQGDIIQARHGSHGDYFPIIFYPNSVEEIYRHTFSAFNAAEESLSPVLLLSDGYISHLYETVELTNYPVVQRGRPPLGAGNRHFTGLTHKDSCPVTSSPEVHRTLLAHFQKKCMQTCANYNFYEYIENDTADTLLIAFGALSRAIYNFKDKYGVFRPIRLFPMIEELKDFASRYEYIVVLEMNTGQYCYEVESLLHREVELLALPGGKIDIKEISDKLQELRQASSKQVTIN
ncbi:MAG TPA: 2-oxoacid:acceptor oxidoreductase subunit alpha [Candidatus Hypogeohydataceae bacterium YC41]